MNILPTSTHMRTIKAIPLNNAGEAADMPGHAAAAGLGDLVSTLEDTQPAGALTAACKSLDQAKAVLTFLDAASEKVLRTTVALTASRGRGKSAAMGLAISGALALGYSNIFVTAPTPENLRTLFEFVFKGLDALDYKEHLDYDMLESTNPAFGKAIVRVNVYRSHRQVCCASHIHPGCPPFCQRIVTVAACRLVGWWPSMLSWCSIDAAIVRAQQWQHP